jgi:hypothetical protein
MGDAEDLRPRGPNGELMTEKQIRARARRRGEAGQEAPATSLGQILKLQTSLQALYKPLDDWDH